jgi:transposase
MFIDLQPFYPDCLKIRDMIVGNRQIMIKLKSLKHQQDCPQCKKEMNYYHATYVRTIQDLPILGKKVKLQITAYEYKCNNPACEQKTFVDDYGDFLSRHGRMTRRLEDFIMILAMQTSCEGAALICREMGITVCGETIINMLKALAKKNPAEKCSETIGVDDFAYRKGKTYNTIICDGETRKPIAILEGRDGKSLKEWLQENKHIKRVTRDRASAYAKVLSEELPDAMQIADRFHLHQNLLKAIKEALKAELPNTIIIPNQSVKAEEVSQIVAEEAPAPAEEPKKKPQKRQN